MARKIFITQFDMMKLRKIIDNEMEYLKDKKYLKDLEIELQRAKIVSINKLPNDVITMNTKTLLLIDSIEERVTLVYPDEADVSENKISVLSPIGTAILGYREGDEVEWNVPTGTSIIKIIKVLYQPESASKLQK